MRMERENIKTGEKEVYQIDETERKTVKAVFAQVQRIFPREIAVKIWLPKQALAKRETWANDLIANNYQTEVLKTLLESRRR